ncbi:hypothetical protein H9Y04_41350 [Streptomyces sp. TRM66268-LWL]|uniref:Uncharacterized protein n=1 Tax=Streptomyces polyasparticus TaxID=2767826 RepID=A0ABR7SXC9_9ACTN|nr:hypothetical protein [Streptomyces polyasparticus]MBC9718993.1 hypothetical protein [Streptomyces polyasparticus]
MPKLRRADAFADMTDAQVREAFNTAHRLWQETGVEDEQYRALLAEVFARFWIHPSMRGRKRSERQGRATSERRSA